MVSKSIKDEWLVVHRLCLIPLLRCLCLWYSDGLILSSPPLKKCSNFYYQSNEDTIIILTTL